MVVLIVSFVVPPSYATTLRNSFYIFFFIEFSHNKLMLEIIQPVVTRQKNTFRKGKTYDLLTSPKKQKKAINVLTVFAADWVDAQNDGLDALRFS